jgi:outer membrane receptor protein involved in Fe transport
MENGDYMKMQNITLGYDFKRLLPSANFLSQMRVYVSVQNLFTITKYSGMDPELGQAGAGDGFGWSSGIDVGYYPTPRTWMVGANFKF